MPEFNNYMNLGRCVQPTLCKDKKIYPRNGNAEIYTGFRGWGGTREQWAVRFEIGESKNFDFFKLENFQKMLKSK